MAFPRSRRMGGGRSSNLWYIVAGVAVGSSLAYSVARRSFGPGTLTEANTQILTLDLTSPPKELNTPSLLQPTQRPSHYDTLRVLDYAANDKSVRGLMARVGPGGEWNMAQAQEIRQASQSRNTGANKNSATQLSSLTSPHLLLCRVVVVCAVERFAQSGKFAHAFADTFGQSASEQRYTHRAAERRIRSSRMSNTH